MPSKLLFVYNAKSGRWNGYLDAAHKLLSPNTYACKLCALTYGILTENERWKAFREKTDIPMEFLHTDEFAKNYPALAGQNFQFPCVLKEMEDHTFTEFISAENFEKIDSVETLIKLVLEENP
ncbi:MAG: GTPase [Flavobacteriaceae bacterium]|nr:GTPase [Flavobacteriaceae bacterium]